MEEYELKVPISKNNDAITKIDKKCIECGYCKKICTNDITVARMFEIKKDIEPICINCGQCCNICPTEAIREKFDYQKIRKLLHKKNKIIALMGFVIFVALVCAIAAASSASLLPRAASVVCISLAVAFSLAIASLF